MFLTIRCVPLRDGQVAHSAWIMCVDRFILGLGVGLASCITPLYLGELSPASMRGRIVTVNCVLITLGQVIAYGKSSEQP